MPGGFFDFCFRSLIEKRITEAAQTLFFFLLPRRLHYLQDFFNKFLITIIIHNIKKKKESKSNKSDIVNMKNTRYKTHFTLFSYTKQIITQSIAYINKNRPA